ncbi:recombinase family protein [Phaeobacter sp. B1627]|uniref:recombinase family protein n=1 Tax=Phaeobacter sp. B1627 TaxID=2583809 RepID=UPI00210645EE|nr:recombinase family protein [Phaeobacter sp. B1627]
MSTRAAAQGLRSTNAQSNSTTTGVRLPLSSNASSALSPVNMAGEYGRELSGKVFAGQCRLIEKGCRQGGPAGYGLRRLLIDEKYIGTNVWNRTSFKVQKRRVRNAPDNWLRAPNGFPALIDPEKFTAAANIIVTRHANLSDREMLDKLQDRLNEQGAVSGLFSMKPWNSLLAAPIPPDLAAICGHTPSSATILDGTIRTSKSIAGSVKCIPALPRTFRTEFTPMGVAL